LIDRQEPDHQPTLKNDNPIYFIVKANLGSPAFSSDLTEIMT
jgi:hypothetical protein